MKILKTILFWVLSCTWGILLTAPGLTCALFLIATRHKFELFGPCIKITVGKNGWGAASIGPVILCPNNVSERTLCHEYGHAIQNTRYGILTPFIVAIPSAFRYWLFSIKTQRNRKLFSFGCFACFYIICIALIVITSALGLFGIAFVFGTALLLCLSYFAWWVFAEELPNYSDDVLPDYDWVWFEGNATNIGVKYFKEIYKNY